MKKLFILIFGIALLSSCKTDTAPTLPQTNDYQLAVDKLAAEPGKASAQNFIKEVRKSLSTTTDRAKTKDLLMKGLNVAEEYKMGSTAIGFLMPLVKDYENSPKREEYVAKLSSALQDVGKTIPGDVLATSYLKNYPKGKYTELLLGKQKQKIDDIDAYIEKMAETIFIDPDKFGINKLSAQKYVDACEAYALGFPSSEMAPEYLYRAAEMARTLKTFPKALSIYDWIESKYPKYAKAPTTMFLKGFMLENELNDKEAARTVYNDFLAKYPGNDLEDDVKFLLTNIDKSDEEIMKMIDKGSKK